MRGGGCIGGALLPLHVLSIQLLQGREPRQRHNTNWKMSSSNAALQFAGLARGEIEKEEKGKDVAAARVSYVFWAPGNYFPLRRIIRVPL